MQKIIFAILAVVALAAATPARAQDGGDPTIYAAGYVDAAYAARNQVAALLRQYAGVARKQKDVLHFAVLQRTSPNN